ncbi:MAG TPA: flagellar motor switch protein FliN [bacterium]|nr:flagellar motor switch protein FliN [bacterium]
MGDPTLNQDEIDALLADVQDPTEGPIESGGGGGSADISADFGDLDGGSSVAQEPSMTDIGSDDFGAAMLDETPSAPAAAPQAPKAPQAPIDFPSENIEVLLDVPLQVVVELGRTEMPIQKILELGPGSVVELNRLAGEPINILVNGKLVARGEVVVVDETFGVKITNIISPMERLTQLN